MSAHGRNLFLTSFKHTKKPYCVRKASHEIMDSPDYSVYLLSRSHISQYYRWIITYPQIFSIRPILICMLSLTFPAYAICVRHPLSIKPLTRIYHVVSVFAIRMVQMMAMQSCFLYLEFL